MYSLSPHTPGLKLLYDFYCSAKCEHSGTVYNVFWLDDALRSIFSENITDYEISTQPLG